MTGSTCINPAVGFALQLIAAWGAGDFNIIVRDVWPLIVPSILGAICGAFFTKKFYEPLLLYVKYKDLKDEDFEDLSDGRSQDGAGSMEKG